MRDAIQGMLSMSRMGGLQLSTLATASDPPQKKPIRQRRGTSGDDDIADKMANCYKDSEFGKEK